VKQSRRSISMSMNNGVRPMLAEKFYLVLESLIKGQTDRVPTYSDGAPRVLSSSAHVPIVLPDRALTVLADAQSHPLPQGERERTQSASPAYARDPVNG
jgi:hypothetical protein